MKKEKQCKMCGKMFEYKTSKAMYCSGNCKEKFRVINTKHDATCPICDNTFYSKNGNKKFCSHPCSVKDASNKKLWKLLWCEDCGEPFLFQGRTKKLRCEPCRRAHRSSQSNQYQANENPDRKIGAGSGGAQWGEDNHRWNEYAMYHGNKGYTHGYRANCFSVWERECACCGRVDFSATFLDVHHIDGDRTNKEVENLIPLCRRCHGKVHNSKKKEINASDYIEALTIVFPKWMNKQSQVLG